MAVDRDTDANANAQETTPLLSKDPPGQLKHSKSVLYRALICGFMVSLSFGVTQVPLIYVFRLMTCDAYYKVHPEPDPAPGLDRCNNREIEASTSYAVALLSASTTAFGVINLFGTGWSIKKFGVKTALLLQVFWPAVRLAVQNIGVQTGGEKGILIIQWSQIITIVGGPAGYFLALNTFVTEVIEPKERTGALGQLQGCTMFGTAIAYLAGGLISGWFGIIAPFRVTLTLFLTSCLYVLFFLPWIPPNTDAKAKASKGIVRFFGPLKTFAPQKWVLRDGRIQPQYGALLLGLGVFLGVLATGYIPVLLQMYSTDEFGFGTTENGYLISMYSLLRGLFLTLVFPRTITAGRKWVKKRSSLKRVENREEVEYSAIPALPTDINDMDIDEEPIEPPQPTDEQETFAFDLMYAKYSLVMDGIITGGAAFINKGWQIYLLAALLPFASGTGSASKGTILQMCPASERTDALSGITLLEMIARLSTTTVFGILFAAFANMGKTYLTFVCNAAVAMLGFCVLMFSWFPPEGSHRLDENHVSESQID